VQLFKRLKELFQISEIHTQISLTDVQKNAEVTFERSLKEDREYKIVILENSSNPAYDSEQNGAPEKIEEEKTNNFAKGGYHEISYHDLLNMRFDDDEIVSEISAWAAQFKFKIRRKEGLKEIKMDLKELLNAVSRNVNTDYSSFQK